MSCEIIYGQDPPAREDDPAFKEPCYKLCMYFLISFIHKFFTPGILRGNKIDQNDFGSKIVFNMAKWAVLGKVSWSGWVEVDPKHILSIFSKISYRLS